MICQNDKLLFLEEVQFEKATWSSDQVMGGAGPWGPFCKMFAKLPVKLITNRTADFWHIWHWQVRQKKTTAGIAVRYHRVKYYINVNVLLQHVRIITCTCVDSICMCVRLHWYELCVCMCVLPGQRFVQITDFRQPGKKQNNVIVCRRKKKMQNSCKILQITQTCTAKAGHCPHHYCLHSSENMRACAALCFQVWAVCSWWSVGCDKVRMHFWHQPMPFCHCDHFYHHLF